MKIQAFSDTHGQHEKLQLDYSDVLIFAGDNHCRRELEHANFLEWFAEQPAKYKIFVPGNHDIYCEEFPEEARQLVEDNDIIYLNGEEIVIDGIKFWGSPITPEFYDWAFMMNYKEREEYWKKIPRDTDVLITHGPPFGILDWCPNGNVGCPHLNSQVYIVKPRLHIFGHIHESAGEKRIDKTTFMNVSMLDGKYRLYNRDIPTVEIL